MITAYHERTKHTLARYAEGPGTLDWDLQPNPFRDWSGTQQLALPKTVQVPHISWRELANTRDPYPLDSASVGSLLRLCVGLSAWKSHAGASWSLRVPPSSGNLHPTETWLIASGVEGVEDGLHHYHPLLHALERRAWGRAAEARGLWLGLSSIQWREAWKYGERAFRYCPLSWAGQIR